MKFPLRFENLEQRRMLHGSDAGSATPVDSGSATIGQLESEADQDWFVLAADAGISYMVQADGAAISLTDAEGNPLDALGSTYTRPYSAAEDTSVYVIVSGGSEYTLTVDSYADDHGNAFSSATAVVFGQSIEGRIERDNEFDYFKLDATAGTTYVIPFEANEFKYATIHTGDGERLATSQKNGWVAWTAETDLEAFVVMRGREGDYQLDILDLATVDEIGNDIASAVELASGQTIVSRIDAPNDTDWFVVTGEVGEFISIDLSRGRSQLRAYLPDGTLLGDVFSSARIPPGGQLYLELLSRKDFFNYEIAAYRVQQGGSSKEDAVTIPVGSILAGQFLGVDDEDWFAFNAEAGKDYHVTTTRGNVFLSVENGFVDTSFFRATVDQQVFVTTAGSAADYRLTVREVIDDFSDAPATATDIESYRVGELTVDDEDWFRFEPTTGVTYRFQTFGPELSLWNEVGEQIIEADGEFVAWTAESNEDIYLRVALPDVLTGLTSYSLFIQDVGELDDVGNSPADATRREAGMPYSSFIDIPGDSEWFVFSVNADTTYRFYTEGLPPGLRVYDTDGTTLINEDSSADDGVLFLEFDSSRDIYVEVTGDTFAQRYVLNVDEFTDDHGNDLTTATSIPDFSSQVQGNVDIAGDVDLFSFEAKAGDWVMAEVSSRFAGTLQILDETGTALPNGSVSTFRYSTIITEDATYYLKVTSNQLEDYSVNMSLRLDDHGNIATLATPIPETPIDGQIDHHGDEDWFSFTAIANRSYIVDADTSGLPIEVYDSNGELVSNTKNVANLRFSQDSDLSIRLLTTNGNFARYTLSVLDYEDDHSHLKAAATPFSGSLVQTGNIEDDRDIDMFSFEAEAGKSYYISATPLVVINLSTETTQLGRTDSARNGILYESPASQTLFMKASKNRWSNDDRTDYEINIHVVGDNDDHSDTPSNATAIQLGLTTTWVSEYPQDEDFFRLEAQPGITYTIQGFGIKEVRALKSNGERLTQPNHFPSGLSFDVESPQTVSIGVRGDGDGQAYSLTVIGFADDHGQSPATATTLTLDQPNPGKLETIEDSDLFRFDAKAGESYLFALKQAPNQGAIIRLINDNTNFWLSGTEKLIVTPSEDEVLFLRVENSLFQTEQNSYEMLAQDFSTLDDHGTSPSNATNIELDQTVAGTITARGDDDWFSVNVEPNTQYNLSTTDSVRATILGADGETILQSAADTPLFLNSMSNHQLFIKLPGNQRTDYELTIRGTTDDHGDEISTATDIHFNELVRGGIQLSDDVDFFRITTDKPVVFTLNIDLVSLDDATFRIRDATGDILNHRFISDSHRQQITLSNAGTFFVEIGGWGGVGVYELALRSDQLRIDDLCSRLAVNEFDESFDLVADGRLDQLDVDALIRDEMGTNRGDIDLNGEVNFADFLMLTARFGQAGLGWAGGDFDCSGDVGFEDFLHLASNFGKTSPSR